VLIENYSGKLPFWLAPIQVAVATIISDVDDYAKEIIEALENAGIRCHSDLRNEKISYKVREHSAAKIPMIMAIGAREKESKTVSIRRIGSDKTEIIGFDEALKVLTAQNSNPHKN
jgi:threonyl-tRNA synthetase